MRFVREWEEVTPVRTWHANAEWLVTIRPHWRAFFQFILRFWPAISNTIGSGLVVIFRAFVSSLSRNPLSFLYRTKPMDTNSQPQSCQFLFSQWQDEHRLLNQFTEELRQWSYQVAQLGIPHFGEAADKLIQLRHRLVDHFQREDQIGHQLLSECDGSVEMRATCRSASSDHENLLKRLDDLIARHQEVDPRFESWQQAMNEVDLFLDAMEQHEEQESANITWLTPQARTESS